VAKKNESASARQARLDQIRKEQQASERRRMIIGSSVLVVVIIALVIGVWQGIDHNKSHPVTGKQILPSEVTTGETTVQPTPATVPNTTGIDGVVAYDTKGYPAEGTADSGTLGHVHVTGPVKYAVLPPVGGPHNPYWMNAGVYDKPVPNEHAVHDLEHGVVWITYRPNLPAAQVKQLQALVGKQSMIDEGGTNENRFMDLSPWADNSLPSPIVVSSWGYQLKVDSPTDKRIQQFIDKFRHNKTYTPEYGAAVDGIPVETGGQPLMYGSKFANPSGSAQ